MNKTITVNKKTVAVGNLIFGGARPIIIAGPCAVESAEQIDQMAARLRQLGVDMLRGGIFKPRTSPYDFQGLGMAGLDYLTAAARRHNLPFITEVMAIEHLEVVAERCDMIQIGARNMYNYPLLKAVGKLNKPVLLKRAFSATLREWRLAAEHIIAAGNRQVVLCERGIRSFDDATRNTLDIAAVPLMQRSTGLPVIVDPSHATGRSDLIDVMSCAAVAAGADGLMIEVHADPANALSDGPQSVKLSDFNDVLAAIRQIAARGGKNGKQ